jgi:predicted HicB family RNase H-like nuclease
MQKFNLLRKPKTNIQILQQSVLLKYKAFVSFLKEHGAEAFPEVSERVMVRASESRAGETYTAQTCSDARRVSL